MLDMAIMQPITSNFWEMRKKPKKSTLRSENVENNQKRVGEKL